jgi:hypothetical protein
MSRRSLWLGFFLAWFSTASMAAPPQRAAAPHNDTPPLQFVDNYITQLATFEDLRDAAARELEEDKAQGQSQASMMACLHSNTRYDLEVGAAIRAMRSTRLVGVDKELQTVPQSIADLYAQRQQVVAQMTKVCSAFAEGPKDGVDYKGLATLMPQIRAQLDYLDNTMFEASPLVFATLISDVPDSQGHASHLVISCDDRKRLVDHIDSSCGA